jgi:hypothetical protein
MNKNDKQTMEAHGITCAPKNVYFYKDFKYDRLDGGTRHYLCPQECVFLQRLQV